MKFEAMMNEEILNKLAEATNEEEFANTLAENNISAEEAAAFVAHYQDASEELSEDALGGVTGGASKALIKAAFIGIKYAVKKAKEAGILGGPLKPIKNKK